MLNSVVALLSLPVRRRCLPQIRMLCLRLPDLVMPVEYFRAGPIDEVLRAVSCVCQTAPPPSQNLAFVVRIHAAEGSWNMAGFVFE